MIVPTSKPPLQKKQKNEKQKGGTFSSSSSPREDHPLLPCLLLLIERFKRCSNDSS